MKYALSQIFMRFFFCHYMDTCLLCFSYKQLFVMMSAKTAFLTHLCSGCKYTNDSNLASSPSVSTSNWQRTVFLCNFVRHMKNNLFFEPWKLRNTFFKCLSTCWGCEHWSAWVEVFLSVQKKSLKWKETNYHLITRCLYWQSKKKKKKFLIAC